MDVVFGSLDGKTSEQPFRCEVFKRLLLRG